METGLKAKICELLGHPFRRRGNDAFCSCLICNRCITYKETYPKYITKYGIYRRGFFNKLYRIIFKIK